MAIGDGPLTEAEFFHGAMGLGIGAPYPPLENMYPTGALWMNIGALPVPHGGIGHIEPRPSYLRRVLTNVWRSWFGDLPLVKE